METTKILTADLLDIVFDGRNKNYGAYELRKNYHQRMIKALLITAGLFLAIAGGAWLKSVLANNDKTPFVKISEAIMIIEDIKPIEKELPPPPTPPPAPKVEVPKIKTIEFVTPIVTSDVVLDPPPTQDDIATARIGNITQDGINDVSIIAPPESLDNGTGLIGKSVNKNDEDKTFIKVEMDATYPGNWKTFLERNLSASVAVDNGAAPGIYKVVIEFIVDKQGKVSDIKPITNIGFGMEDEAMRVIKKSGKWKPAIQNGQEVKAYRKQPITFQVLDS